MASRYGRLFPARAKVGELVVGGALACECVEDARERAPLGKALTRFPERHGGDGASDRVGQAELLSHEALAKISQPIGKVTGAARGSAGSEARGGKGVHGRPSRVRAEAPLPWDGYHKGQVGGQSSSVARIHGGIATANCGPRVAHQGSELPLARERGFTLARKGPWAAEQRRLAGHRCYAQRCV